MSSNELNMLLLESFPEISNDFEAYVSWQDGMDTGCFLTFEDLLLPITREALQRGEREMLTRFGLFVEELMASQDDYAINVATVGLLEGIKAEGDESIRKYLGRSSLEIYDTLRY